ncbi:Sec-independent protein translocase protein TatB [Ectopseudomonas mendocina]|uniref:Sec-independent protein translocase protein TatB n=1 Tax=Ectopseudomonas mendocina TaxID=300 RepID=A0ABZ2RGZ1_ECTME
MFDIGFSELLLVGLVALIVLGPERLPGAVRTAGLWIGRIKRSFNAIKQQVEQEIGADEIRRQLHNEQILQLEREMNAMKQELISAGKLADPNAPAPEQPAPVAQPNSEAPAPAAPVTSAQTVLPLEPPAPATPATPATANQATNQDKPQP